MDHSKQVLIDFETYYDADCSVTKLGAYAYTRHPKFDAYMVSVVNDEIRWVGHPQDFDWASLGGFEVGAHNAGFDQTVFEFLQEKGVIPPVDIPRWFDTADLAAYMQAPRSLAGAVKAFYGEDLSKAMRTGAKGETWEDMIQKGKTEDMLQYALDDSIWAWRIWKDYAPEWPESERLLSDYTRLMCMSGLPVDTAYVAKCIKRLDKQLHEAYSSIPWAGEWDEKYKKPYGVLSKRALALECRKIGIPPPTTMSKTEDAFTQWVETHEGKAPWITSVVDYRRINTLRSRFDTIRTRTREDGFMPYGLKYWGASTGRWSGDSGFNVQNMPRGEMFDTTLRYCFRAPDGKSLVVSDLSNIEPRCLSYIIGDWDTLDLVRQGVDLYEAHARTSMGYTDALPLKREDGDPRQQELSDLRTLAKIRVLMLGYGSGWLKLFQTMKGYGLVGILDKPVSNEQMQTFLQHVANYHSTNASLVADADEQTQRMMCNAWIQVTDFRAQNPSIVDLWKQLDNGFRSSSGGEYSIKLPSGRSLRYFDIRPETDGFSCRVEKRSRSRYKFYGSKFVENVVQATARDVFAHSLLRMYKENINIIAHIHDEVIVLCDTNEAEDVAKRVTQIFSEPPEWLEGCPLASDYRITDKYTK